MEQLGKAFGPEVVKDTLNDVVKCLLPNTTLQCVKQCLRREARKPLDMSAKQDIMHIYCINTEEIPCCPPAFATAQCFGDDEIVDILFFGAPKSWQREMGRQGFDPLTKTPTEVVEFMERIEMSEDFDANKKVPTATTKKGDKKKAGNGKGNSDADGSKYCVMHGKNDSHNANECQSLKAYVKKAKSGNENSAKGGKGKNKTWKNKSDKGAEDSKKELAALTKTVQDNNNISLTNSLISLLLKILMAELKGPFDRLCVEVRCCWLCCSEGQLQT